MHDERQLSPDEVHVLGRDRLAPGTQGHLHAERLVFLRPREQSPQRPDERERDPKRDRVATGPLVDAGRLELDAALRRVSTSRAVARKLGVVGDREAAPPVVHSLVDRLAAGRALAARVRQHRRVARETLAQPTSLRRRGRSLRPVGHHYATKRISYGDCATSAQSTASDSSIASNGSARTTSSSRCVATTTHRPSRSRSSSSVRSAGFTSHACPTPALA